jgi:hypothetical protein
MISCGGSDSAFFRLFAPVLADIVRSSAGKAGVCPGRYTRGANSAGPDFALLEMQSLCKLYC